MTVLIDPHTFAGTAPPPAPGAAAPSFLSLEDFAGVPQPASPPAPQPDMKVIGIGDGGVPIFADPQQNAELGQNMGDYNARVSEKGLEGATFGLAPYAEAPIVSAVTGKPLSEGLKTAREYTAETSRKYPGSSMVAEGIGMSVPTVATAGLINPAESVVGRAAQAGAIGGLTGGAAAAGHDVGSGQTDHIIRDTAVGTGVGAGLGAGGSLLGDIARPIIDWVARKFSPEAANSQAIQRIAQRIGQDQKAGGPSAQDMLDALNEAGSEPHTIADVGGNNVLGEAGRVARAPGPGKQTAINTLTSRDAGEGANLANVVGANVSGGGSAYSAAKALSDARATAAAPLYDAAFQGGSIAPLQDQLRASLAAATGAKGQIAKQIADIEQNNSGALAARGAAGAQTRARYMDLQKQLQQAEADRQATLEMFKKAQSDAASNAPGAVWSPRIQQFLDDPIMKAGLARGVQIQRLESVAAGKPFNPSEYAITGTDEAGNPIVGSVPNMRLLDAGKRGLDAIIGDNTDAVTGKVNELGRAVTQFKNAYLKELDGINPDYADARAAYSGPSQSMKALEAGSKILTQRPEEIADTIANLSPGDKEFYKLGAADTLITNLSKSGRNANEANSLARNEYMRQQLRPLFDSDADYQKFMGAVERANRRFETKYQTIGNSATAGRVAEDDSSLHANNPLVNAAEAGLGLATGERFPLFQGAFNFIRGLGGNRPPQSPEVNAAISRMLFETNPANRAQIMGRILRQMNAGRAVSRLAAPSVAGTLGGGGYPSLFPTSPSLIGQTLIGPTQ